MTDLAREVHERLNATALPRRPVGPPPALARPGSRPLPVPPRPTGDLGEVLARRRSTYAYGGHPSSAQLAAVLHHGVGTAPRAGGLPSLVPHLVAGPGGALPPGVHRADLRLPLPGLVAVRDGDPTAYVAGALDQPRFAARVPVWLVVVADLAAAAGRYPSRHYRTLHLDAGAALQNALLVATALGLVTCPVSGYDDHAWARLLDLGLDEVVTVVVALGAPPEGPRSGQVRAARPR